jgi:hypothetical protein
VGKNRRPKPPGRYTLEDGRPLHIVDLPDGTRVSTITDWDGKRIRVKVPAGNTKTSKGKPPVSVKVLRALGGPEDRPQPPSCEVCGQALRPKQIMRNGNMAPTMTCSDACRQQRWLRSKAGLPVSRIEPTGPRCVECNEPLTRKPGPGRPPQYCSTRCGRINRARRRQVAG